MAVFTDAQLASVVSEIEKQNNTLYKFVAKYATNTWAKLQAIVKTGRAREFFEIGDEFTCTYTDEGVSRDFPWRVVDFRNVELENGSIVPGMVLQSKYACFDQSGVKVTSYDLPEQVEAEEENAEEGVYYFGLTGTTVSLDAITPLDLNAGDAIPYGDYTKVFKTSVNSSNVIVNGWSCYEYSAFRKWLNSDADVGEDWFGELDHVGQVKPQSATTIQGFMHGLDDDFLAVINRTGIKFRKAYDTSNYDMVTLYDKFWLPSKEEMYGVNTGGYESEGNYFAYWKEVTGLDEPSDLANESRRFQKENSQQISYENVFLRTTRVNGTTFHLYSVFNNTNEGSLKFRNSYYADYIVPCCVIC